MTKTLFFSALLLLTLQSYGQIKFVQNKDYTNRSQRALRFYDEKNYQQSALSYDSLFEINKGRGLTSDKYNAACSWALAGNLEKAFSYLHKVVFEDKWNNLSHITTDTDLSSLHADKRWKELIEKVKKNKEKAEAKLNKPLVALLDSIYREDQYDRRNIDTVQKQFGWQSKQMDSLWKKIGFQDSVNLIRVKKIVDNYGWLGSDIVGQQGAATFFLVIQHADSLTQVTYLPIMRQAVKEGKAQPDQLALLEDRILTNQGKPQIYGSQVRRNDETGKNEFFPIIDELNVNKRRASVGLGKLEDYAKYFGIDYSLPETMKQGNKY